MRADVAGTYAFHDPDDDYRLVLDLLDAAVARPAAEREALAERLRLLYVALTRAEHRCYIVWGRISQAGTSALAWLLHPPVIGQTSEDIKNARREFGKLSDAQLRDRLQALCEPAAGAIEIVDIEDRIDSTSFSATADTAIDFQARQFDGRIRQPWRVTSYSALAHQGSGTEDPDYDATPARQAPAESTGRTIHTFPRGARPGQCLHTVFENIDFTRADRAATETLIAEKLRAFGYAETWLPVISTMVRNVLAAPLDAAETVRLGAIPETQRLTELEFYYPLANITPQGMMAVLRQHEFSAGITFDQQIGNLSFSPVKGYMKGFIDLVFETGGRFYILDYKSNWLGNEAADYTPDRLERAMAEADYHLQYLIYTIALHRYLRSRLPGYDYDIHIGGVFYLFLRGITPDVGQDTGIYRSRPGKALVEALDAWLLHGDGPDQETPDA